MTYNNESTSQHQQRAGGEENNNEGRKEQFNELSELSLEERMAVADQMGVPADNAGDAALTGTMRVQDENTSKTEEQIEEESTDGETLR